jgi:uncharacterized cupredoxin-like copper-binding protein
MKHKTFSVMLLLAAAAILIAGCGPQSTSISSTMTDFEFTPEQWQVEAGAEVVLRLSNNASVTHDWVLMPMDYEPTPPTGEQALEQAIVEFSLEAGESGTFSFTAPSQPGEYAVICTEPGHLENDMRATLIVE